MKRWEALAGSAGVLTAAFVVARTRERPIVRVARREHARWEGLHEYDAAARPLLEKYWTEGAEVVPQDPSVPWSAAFVSWAANRASPGSLRPSASHMAYAGAASRASGPGAYVAYRPEDVVIEPGDIVVQGRAGETPTFEDLGSGEQFKTHGDIVVDVYRGVARTIGGNVWDTVGVNDYALTPSGHVSPAEGVFVVLKAENVPPSGWWGVLGGTAVAAGAIAWMRR